TDKKGLLIPRTVPGAINSPAESLLIYNIDDNKFSFYDGTGWQSFCHENISTTTGSSSFTSDGTGINTSSVDASARLELNGTDKGLLIPRMSAANRDNIISPATGLMLYNTTDKSIDVYTGTEWHQLMYEVPAQPGTINGNTTVCENATGETYSIFSVNGATSYTWTVPSGATITDGQGTPEITVDFDAISGNICVTANNGCGSSNPACESISVEVCDSSPCAGYEGNTYDYEVVYDGYTYEVVEIGDQCWFAENLRYDNGCSSVTWVNYSDEGWCGCYNNYCATYIDTYGMLYQWSAAMNGSTNEGAQGLCPAGWHIPSDDDFITLEMTLGMTQTAADETGYRGTNEGSQLAGNAPLWDTGDLTTDGAFGSSGFKALPGGDRGYTNGSFYHFGSRGHFITSTETSNSNKYHRTIRNTDTGIGRFDYPKSSGVSVRCLRD
ncbi:MAG: FISUMP domain-containing protein, partial [Bacteroidota bacterium]